tara:strand:+ start:113 stop:2452 length:2340 start_codon:yes stop_codon:yes gene_type:complete
MNNPSKFERENSAILFTDIADFSKITSNNEEYAYQIIEKMRKILLPIVKKKHGKLIKEIGDGTLSIFSQPQNAINCAKEFQRISKSIKDLSIRTGIHFGEIIKEKKDVFGDVVNIAKRLESLATPGSVIVSKEVIDNIDKENEFNFISLGLQALKGAGRLVEVLALDHPNLIVPNIKEFSSSSIHVHEDKEVPSIAIIPFENKGLEEDIFYTYGISSDLISDVSSAGVIRVASMKNIEALKQCTELSLEEFGSKLFVRYIATGSLWKMNDIFQLSIELYDTKNKCIIWSDRWQEKWENLISIKEKLSDGLLKSLSTNRKVKSKPQTLSSKAYEFYLKGKYKYEKRKTKEDQEIAQLLLEKALELDEYLVIARIQLGIIFNEIGQYSEALKIFLKAKIYAEELDDKIGISSALNSIGNIHLLQGEYGNAKKIYLESLAIRKKIEDKVGIAGSLNNLGNLYRRKGEYKYAFKNYKKCLSIVEEIEDKSGVATALNNMGVMQRLSNDYNQSLQSYKRAYKIRKELQDINGMALLLNNIGNIYFHQNKLQEALKHYHQSLEVVRETDNKIVIANSLNNEANIYFTLADYETALNKYTESLNIRKDISDKQGIASSFINIGMIYSIFGNYNKALICFNQSKDLRIWLNEKGGLVSALINIAKINFKIFNYENVLISLNRALKIQTDLNQKSPQIAEIELLKMLADKLLEKEVDESLMLGYIEMIKEPNFELCYYLYLLTSNKKYLKNAYNELINRSKQLDEKINLKYISYPFNNQIIQEYKEIF